MPFSEVSLLHGSFPSLLGTIALCSLGIAALRDDRRWIWFRLLPIVVVSFVVVAVVNARLDLGGRFDAQIPVEFLVWVTMPMIAAGVALFGWRGDRRWRRIVSVLAVPFTGLYAANLINQYYGYEPTLGALFGADVVHQVDSGRLGLAGAAAPSDRRWGSTSSSPALVNALPGPLARVPGGAEVTGVPGSLPTRPGHGLVSTLTIPGVVSGFTTRPAYVWVPPAFFDSPRPRLPVIVVLAGVPGQPVNMIRAAGATTVAETYAAAHRGSGPILVFADANGSFANDTECVDSGRGNAETYLSRDVPAFVESAFSTASGPGSWGILGYSEGGTCAMEMALGHPDVYGSFVDIAGDPFPNLGMRGDAKRVAIDGLYGGDAARFDAHDPLLLAKRTADRAVGGWFEVGRNDHRKHDIAARLDAALRADGLQSRCVITTGGHDFTMTTHAVADSFPWLAQRIGT